MDYSSLPPLFALFMAIFIIYRLVSSRTNKNLPPGPTPLPLIGHLHLLGDEPHKSSANLSQIYGPIIYLKLGQIRTIIISSPSIAREVLQKQDSTFANRYPLDSISPQNHNKLSVGCINFNSTRFRSLRKVMNFNLFSNSSLDANQSLRLVKVNELIEYCKSQSLAGEAVDIGKVAFRTSLNLLSNTIFSKDLADPYGDSESGDEFRELVTKITLEVGKPNLVDCFPVLRWFDPQGIRRRVSVYFDKMIGIFSSLIDERLEETKLKGSSVTTKHEDMLDVLLNASQENLEDIDSPHIEHLLLDIFIAGTDTTSAVVEWAMAEILRNSEIKKRVQEELKQIVGKGNALVEADITRLPYLNCVVKEAFRLHPPGPFLLPRRVDEDVKLSGFTVPKGSKVLINVWAIGRDSSVWDDPLSFRPERFWQSEIDVKGRNFELLPFGAGRRICPGLPLAYRMVPLLIGSLLNMFDWKLENGKLLEDLNMEEKFGLTLYKASPLRAIPIPL